MYANHTHSPFVRIIMLRGFSFVFSHLQVTSLSDANVYSLFTFARNRLAELPMNPLSHLACALHSLSVSVGRAIKRFEHILFGVNRSEPLDRTKNVPILSDMEVW